MIPRSGGTYILVIVMTVGRTVAFGRGSRVFHLEAGTYCYVGSALGPGGLGARLRRHASTTKRMHWHIDYLLEHALITGAIVVADERRLECEWARWVEGRAKTRIDGVGASDCSCPGHLFYLGTSTIHDPLIRAAADQLHGRFVPVGEFTVRCSPD